MMNVLVILSQALLYVSLAIIIGTYTLMLVPAQYRPSIYFPKRALLVSIIAIPIATFMPALSSIMYISPRLGFSESFKIVISTYTIGIAWLFTLFLASILLLIVAASLRQEKEEHKGIAALQLIIAIAVIVFVGWSSHASSINVILGTVSDSIHLTSVSIWVGTLIVIAFFSENHANWNKFLVWYSILAATCLGATAISGFLLADILIPNYVNSWMISYGQGIFLKHLFIVPLIFYAALNGFFVKYKLTVDANYNPIRGVKVESFVLLTIFILTAIFTQSSPPHSQTISADAVSPLFKVSHDVSSISEVSKLVFAPSGIAIALVFASLLFLALTIVSYIKKAPVLLMFLCSVLLVITIYSTFMISVQLQ